MEKEGVFVLFFALMIFSFSLTSANDFDIFYQGGLSSGFSDNYEAGQEISKEVSIYNNENFPIVNASLIVEIVHGCEYPTYPAHDSDCDNIIDEIVISEIYIPARETVKVPFAYELPSDLSSGTYRIDFFLRTLKTPIVGMNHIHMGGINIPLEVIGKGSFPNAKISRTKTHINEYYGPVGAPVQPGERGVLETYILSERDFNGKIKMTICNWQDSLCEPLYSNEKNVRIIQGEQKVDLDFVSPEKPDAYSVRIELFENERLVSLFRSRLIVQGETAKMKKIQTHKYYYDDEKLTLSLLLAGSPDHYGWTRTPETILEVSVKNNLGGSEYKDSIIIEEFTLENFFREVDFYFDIKGEMSNFRVCAKLSCLSESIIYDEHCYDVDASKFPVNKHLIELKELYEGSRFRGSVCTKNPVTKRPIMSNLEVLVTEGRNIIAQFSGSQYCVDLDFDMTREKNYKITANNLNTRQTEIFEVRLGMDILSYFWFWVLIFGTIAITIIYIFVKKVKSKSEFSK